MDKISEMIEKKNELEREIAGILQKYPNSDIDEGFLDKIEVMVSNESFLTDNEYAPVLTFTFDSYTDAYKKAMEFAEFCLRQGMYVQMKDISEKVI